MNRRLKGKTAIITGASRGIGRAAALRLAREGINLSIHGRSRKDLEEVRKRASSSGADVLICVEELSDKDAPGRIVKNTVERFGGLDILINNAGAASSSPAEKTTREEWDRLMGINASAAFFLCREALPHLKKSMAATIINISSVVGHKGYENQAAYTASKHAMTGFTKALAREAQKDGVRVHLISPGGTATDMVRKTRPDLDESILISPDDIAETAAFLLHMRHTNAAIDEIRIRRASGVPWG